jgi:filamentous hemagglutinin family protein
MQIRRSSIRNGRVVSFLYRLLGHLLALVMALASPIAQAADVAAGNRIVTDGRTQTQVQVNGRRTDIRTRTISGGNAFNSFSHFQTGQGTTVNLHVPGQAKNLINVVRDSPTIINGTLNGYQNGQIGGNIYFATPNGFVVGKSGSVNVGALTVTTPSRAFTESLIGPGGQISDANVARLMSGSFPVSPDGNISIQGRINAKSGVKLVGQSIHIHGPSRNNATLRQTQTFAATVNSSGMEMGGAIEVTDGGIEIVAAGKARIGGRLKASRQAANKAPRIDIRAQDDILIEGTAGIVVDSQSVNYDGGDIIVFSDTNLVVEDGAHFSAGAGGTGNGGFIELSGLKTVTLGAADINLSAPGGKAGTLLIDPEEIEIVNTVNLSPGADVVLQATKSITVTSSGIIDTRVQTLGVTSGNSGDITLEAPSILIEAGGQLLADVNSAAFTAGDISLIAYQSDARVTGRSTADAQVIVDGILRGGNINIKTTAKAESSYNDGAAGIAMQAGTAAASSVLGLNGGYNAADTTSVIRITGKRQHPSDWRCQHQCGCHAGSNGTRYRSQWPDGIRSSRYVR